MTTVTGMTAARMLEIEAASIVDGEIVGNNLILTKHDASTIDAGRVRVGFYSVTADLANISGVAGSIVGDYFVNGAAANKTILGVVAAPGDIVRSTSATVGVAEGSIRGATGAPSGAAGGELAGNYPNPTINGALDAARVFTWGADTNLYRAGANSLKTDDEFRVQMDLIIAINNTSKMYFGSALDTNLYRSGANSLKTDDDFSSGAGIYAAGDIYARATVWQVQMGAVSGAGPGIAMGSTLDVKLYRSATNILKTDNNFQAVGAIVANIALTNQILLETNGAIYFGSALDTNLYRSSANLLKTDDTFAVGAQFQVDATGSIRSGTVVGGATGGAINYKLPIYNMAGTLLGYAPLYAT